MTSQVKGFCWSMGIHGMIILVWILLQFFVVVQDKVAVVYFTFSGESASSVMDQPSLTQPMASQEPKRDKALQKNTAGRHSIPVPEPGRAPLSEPTSSDNDLPNRANPTATVDDQNPAQASTSGDDNNQALDGPHTASGTGLIQNGADRAGTTRDLKGRSVGSGNPGGTPEHSRTVYLKEHFAYIRDKITNGILYPQVARTMGWCGQVKIAFVVCEDGGVDGLMVVESSGFPILDRNAVDTVKKAAPFPRPPIKAEIRMTVTYRLK